MIVQTGLEVVEEQKKRRDMLIEECKLGITKRDTLPNTAHALNGETEAMYFKQARDFLRTSLAQRVVYVANDVYGGK